MEKVKTYVVTCRRGLTKDVCPIVLQEGAHCVECPYVGYVLRVRKEDNDTTKEENNNVES